MQKNRILGATIFLTPSRSNFFVFLEIKFDENILYFFQMMFRFHMSGLIGFFLCEFVSFFVNMRRRWQTNWGKKTPSQTQDDQECVLW